MKRFFVCLMAIAFLFLVLNRTALSSEYIINGGFETGDFTGWMVETEGNGTWVINDGTIVPPGELGAVSPPINGNYDAMISQDYFHISYLYQQIVTLPTNITSATLSWSDRIFNFFPSFNEEYQSFRVLIIDETGEHIIFSTQFADSTIQEGPNSRSFDIASVAQFNEGQEIRIVFEVIAKWYYMNIMVDDISLDIDTVLPGGINIPVEIDIKPGSYPNCLNNDGHGVIPVAILGENDFDVYKIDPATIELNGTTVKIVGKSNKLLAHYEDVNNDGYDDLIVQIEDDDNMITEGETTATVTGNLYEIYGVTSIEGSDSIRIVP